MADISIGAVGASVIAAAVAYLGSILSKEQKTSEFRQAWIDALRIDFSDYLAGVSSMYSMIAHHQASKGNDSALQFILSKDSEMAKMTALRYRIILRLNAKEHAEIIQMTKDIIDDLHKDRITGGLGDSVEEKYITETQRILKSEWNRVKQGEPTFRATKCIALTVAACGLGAIGFQFLDVETLRKILHLQ